MRWTARPFGELRHTGTVHPDGLHAEEDATRVIGRCAHGVSLIAVLGCADTTGPAVPPYAVTVAPDSVTIERRTPVTLFATVQDASGDPYAGPPLLWSSSDTSVATVSAAGAVK